MALSFPGLMAWCSFSIRWESNQTPSQWVTSLLKGMVFPPILVVAAGAILLLWEGRFDLPIVDGHAVVGRPLENGRTS